MAWAVRDTDPSLCAAHGGTAAGPGAPPGNQNALKHGFYAQGELPDDCSIDAIIDNLYQRQIHLDAYIDQVLDELSTELGVDL